MKILMSILVIGIHTEPFGFNIWLDRGFGIITRLCVPFFFVSTAYFFWKKQNSIVAYLKRIMLLYCIWSVVYLPFDFNQLSQMPLKNILIKYLWVGNEHALWFLIGSVWGVAITYALSKLFKPQFVLRIGFFFLLIGCLKSTWAPLTNQICGNVVTDFLGSRNGLFYAFPYCSLGMYIVKTNKKHRIRDLVVGFLFSFVLLAGESIVFVLKFHTTATVLWLSVFPCSYFLFEICRKINPKISLECSILLRKTSTILFTSHFMFIELFRSRLQYLSLFLTVTFCSLILSQIIISLSSRRRLQFLKYMY